jgi:glycine C-acetyltransferase
MLNFCANNYLGLSNNKDLIEEAKRALDQRGYGMSSVRFICGTQDIHKKLESTIASFHSKEDAILYTSCFDANTGFFECILGEQDAIISDTLNHASIIDGIRLCKAKRLRYKHLDLNDLEENLKQAEGSRIKLIVTDGVFSMDGDIAPLDKIVNIAQMYNANVFIDESHSSGFIGKTGRGTPELFGVTSYIDVINSTLGKALGGGSGGYTTASTEIVELLRQKSRPYLFSNSLVPAIVASSIKVFEILKNSNKLVNKLHENTVLFRTEMKKLGFTILGSPESPIVPVLLKDERLATEFGDEMIKEGIYVVGFSYPVVPKGQARIRVQLSAAHTKEMILQAVKAFEKIGKNKKLIITN